MNADAGLEINHAPNWHHVGTFLVLTFGLTWLLNLAIYLHGGLGTPGMIYFLQLQMLLPAFSAIALGLFFFRESPIHRSRRLGRERWFYYYFLLLTAIYVVAALGMWFSPAQGTTILVVASQILAFLGLLILIVLRFAAGRDAMAGVWLAWGNWRYWLTFGLAFAAYYALQAALNAFFALGPAHLGQIVVPPGLSPTAFRILGAGQSVLIGPFLGIVIAFGEEYGWRGYLQSELFKMGRVRGVILLGVIWGAWHWPVILMGYNYPGHPFLGVVLMTFYTVGLAVVLGYAVLKSGSVLLSSYLHALNNQVVAFIVLILGFSPFDAAFSFGMGIYGIATLAIIALLVLRDPIWRSSESPF